MRRSPSACGSGVRVIGAPCIGRCEQAPAAVVGRNPIDRATAGNVMAAIAGKHTEPARARVHRLSRRTAPPADTPSPRLRARRAAGRRRDQDHGGFEPARPGRRRVSGRPQVEDRARRACAAADGRQHRRRRARHVQGSLLPGTRSAPLPRRNADRGVGGRHRRHLRLSARRIRRVPRDPQPGDRRARGRSAVRAAAHPPAPRRRRLHLRRRVGDDRVDRRQARHAAAASAVRRPGRALRAADARAQHGNALLGARHSRKGRAVVRGTRSARPQGVALVFGVGPRGEARRASGARGHHRPRADRRALRRHARRPRVLRLSSGRRLRRDTAGVAGRRSARFRYAAAPRLVHRLGGGHRALAARPRARRGTQPDAILRRRIVRPVHALPRRHRKGRGPPRTRRPGICRCSTSCRGRWRMRRSAAWGRRRPTPSPASSAISRRSSNERGGRSPGPKGASPSD